MTKPATDFVVVVDDDSPLASTLDQDAARLVQEGTRTARGLIAGLRAAGHARRRGTLLRAARTALLAAGVAVVRGGRRR